MRSVVGIVLITVNAADNQTCHWFQAQAVLGIPMVKFVECVEPEGLVTHGVLAGLATSRESIAPVESAISVGFVEELNSRYHFATSMAYLSNRSPW